MGVPACAVCKLWEGLLLLLFVSYFCSPRERLASRLWVHLLVLIAEMCSLVAVVCQFLVKPARAFSFPIGCTCSCCLQKCVLLLLLFVSFYSMEAHAFQP